MNKLSATIAVGMLTATFTGAAHAEPVADGFALGIERAFGLVVASDTTETDLGTTTSSSTNISLGLSRLSGLSTTYSAPRLGMDYILTSGLSFGAGLGFTNVATSTETEFDGMDANETDGGSVTAFVLAPRVGFLIGLTDTLGFWPRGGITHVALSLAAGDDSLANDASQSRTALTLEAPLVLMAGPIGFLIAPTIDIGLSGSQEVDDNESEAEFSATEFGLQFGIMGVL
jgi:hypothetical protein